MKPKISAEAKRRIRAFAAAVADAQDKFGVSLAVQDDSFAFRDQRRKEAWILPDGQVYGEWDAQIFDGARVNGFRLRNLRFEDFDAWDS